jgi:hypothetical protein
VKGSPEKESGAQGMGAWERAREKAEMPLREVKARAEKESSAPSPSCGEQEEGRRNERREERVEAVGPTEIVGTGSGVAPRSWRRRVRRVP